MLLYYMLQKGTVQFHKKEDESRMKKVISLMLSMMMLVLLASAALSESQGTDMYAYT